MRVYFLQVCWHRCPALLHRCLLLAQHVLRQRVPLHEVLVDKLAIGAGCGLCAERTLTMGVVLTPSNELVKCLHLGAVVAGVETPGWCQGVGANGGTGQAGLAMARAVTPAQLLHRVAAWAVLVWALTVHVPLLLAVPTSHVKARLLDSASGRVDPTWVRVGVLGVFSERWRRCHWSPAGVPILVVACWQPGDGKPFVTALLKPKVVPQAAEWVGAGPIATLCGVWVH
jgi:hypothetical protein